MNIECLRLILILTFITLATQHYGQQIITLWEGGAPGFENRQNEPEQAKDWWVKNIHNPSLTVYLPPKEIATGTAIIVCPGGGHRELVFNAEGKDAAAFLNKIGITVFVLKYRLAREPNSPYTLEKHVKQDALRAVRIVRSNANEWGLNPDRIGMMGFSAGGEVVSLIAYDQHPGDAKANDAIDQTNANINFQILIYPGPLFIPETIPANAPPAFLLAANGDVCCSEPVVQLLQKYRNAKTPVEVHLYAQGNHAFNMGDRSTLKSINSWPQRLADWLNDNGYLVLKK